MENQFSVLMSMYFREKPEYFHECMESVLASDLLPGEIVIVKDGPLTPELEAELLHYGQHSPVPLVTVPLPQNRGLGPALAEGLLHCKYPLVARMDTDDLCVPHRFRLQLEAFRENPELDIVGGHIREFDTDPSHPNALRSVPLTNEEIRKYQRRRCAFNHVTVMFKKESVLRVGNYKDAPYMEDDLLWSEMLAAGCVGKNLDEVLVLVRTGESMIARRGGWEYFQKYRDCKKRVLKIGYISRLDYLVTCGAQLAVSLMPPRLRQFVYLKFLRKE